MCPEFVYEQTTSGWIHRKPISVIMSEKYCCGGDERETSPCLLLYLKYVGDCVYSSSCNVGLVGFFFLNNF